VADDPADPADPAGRRRFLKIATCAVGGGIGASLVVPVVRYLVHPVGRRVVSAASEPIDAMAVSAIGPEPVRVPLVARQVRDGWSTTTDVPLGAAWVHRDPDGKVVVQSSVCPHLGCAVAFNRAAGEFRCPCHDSAFAPSGERLRGPAERGLDELPSEQAGDRLLVTWIRYRQGGSTREPV